MKNSATVSATVKFAYLLLKKLPNMYFPYLKLICIPSPRVGLADLARYKYLFLEWCCPLKLLREILLWVFFRGAEQEQNSLQSLSCVQQMTPRRRWDGICDLDSRLGCSSLLEQSCLSLPDLSCILPNKYFSSLHSSDYALHWIQIKRQNVSLISTVMWDR